MPPKKARLANSGTENELSGNESEISVSSAENPAPDSSEDEHESDDSSDMDLEECDERRVQLLKDVQDLEHQFFVLREQLYRERISQVDNQIAELKAGTSAQYVARLKLLDNERRARVETAGVLREVRIENLNNNYEAEKAAADQNFENEKKLTRDRINKELLDTIEQLEEDRRNSEIVWGENGKWGCKKPPTSRPKKAVTVSGPYIVYMLKPEEIMEDWTAIRKASQDN